MHGSTKLKLKWSTDVSINIEYKISLKSFLLYQDVTNLAAAYRNFSTQQSQQIYKKKSINSPVSLHSSPPCTFELLAQYLYGEVPKNFVKISWNQAEVSDSLYFFKNYQPKLSDLRQFLHIKKVSKCQVNDKSEVKNNLYFFSPLATCFGSNRSITGALR